MFLRNLVLSALLFGSAPVLASSFMCPTGAQRANLGAFRDRIAAAKTPEAAKEMAYTETRLGHQAIARAAHVLPHSADLADAEARLDTFDAGVGASTSQAQVAGQLDSLMATQAMDGGHCEYTPSEVVIIVIGFLLGILPGILFLFLFC